MRFNDVITLVTTTATQDEAGVFHDTEVKRDVFANPYTIGANAYMAAQSAGLHADAEFQIRSAEYNGEQVVRRGEGENEIEYTVETVINEGEYTRIILAKRLRNSTPSSSSSS